MQRYKAEDIGKVTHKITQETTSQNDFSENIDDTNLTSSEAIQLVREATGTTEKEVSDKQILTYFSELHKDQQVTNKEFNPLKYVAAAVAGLGIFGAVATYSTNEQPYNYQEIQTLDEIAEYTTNAAHPQTQQFYSRMVDGKKPIIDITDLMHADQAFAKGTEYVNMLSKEVRQTNLSPKADQEFTEAHDRFILLHWAATNNDVNIDEFRQLDDNLEQVEDLHKILTNEYDLHVQAISSTEIQTALRGPIDIPQIEIYHSIPDIIRTETVSQTRADMWNTKLDNNDSYYGFKPRGHLDIDY